MDKIITKREITAMVYDDLLAFVHKHAHMLGNQYPKHMEDFYCPRILDKPHLLRKLCQQDLDLFTQMVREMNLKEYIEGGKWAAVLLSQGGTLPEEVLRQQESVMSAKSFTTSGLQESDISLLSVLFLEVSEKARQLWSAQYSQATYGQLAKVLKMREDWLGCSQTESTRILYTLGWKPLDVMLTYALESTDPYKYPIDPDCVSEAARLDPETAVWLLEPKHYNEYFNGRYHPSDYPYMAGSWAEFLYLRCGWTDISYLKKEHRPKRWANFCQHLLEHIQTPDWERRRLEDELKKAGLLNSEMSLDWANPKLAKAQRLALTKAMVCHYQWKCSELLTALSTRKPEVFTGLLWGIYQEDQLMKAILLDRSGNALDENGDKVPLPKDAWIGLVVPAELSKQQLILWKKRVKACGVKPFIRQLSIPPVSNPPEDYEGVVTKHITIYSAAGKWGMEMGNLPKHCRADLIDSLHGYGARILFDPLWDGSEYNGDEELILGISFYCLDKLPFGDYLPQRAVVQPEDLPARFVSIAGAAFKQMTGIKL
jgi:hypothetical protein